MKQQQFEQYIKRVSANHNISPEEVLQDIERCIAESCRAVSKEENRGNMEPWQNVSDAGGVPTAYEFIAHLAQMVLRELEREQAENG